MSEVDNVSLQAIHDQLANVLEVRVTELMTEIKMAQALSRKIARTEEEIDRQRLLREQLTADLGPMRAEAASVQVETEALQAELDQVSGGLSRLREVREELRAIGASMSEEAAEA